MTHALVVDDNAMNIEVLKMLLNREGVTCTTTDAPQNLEVVLAQDPNQAVDVVFLDLEMPNYDGFALYEMLSNDARFASARFVAYTVHTGEVDRARQYGFHSFLSKPLNLQKFPEQLQRILAGERVWAV